MNVPEERKSPPESAEAVRSSQSPLKWPKIAADYHGALVRLATMRAANKQHLIFGYVELFPRDIPLPGCFSARGRPWAVPSFGGGITLVASAAAMPVADALAWYEEAAFGRVNIPRTSIDLATPPFGVEPALGRFCVGEDVPFAPPWHRGPRIHRLVPMEDPDEDIQKLGLSAAARLACRQCRLRSVFVRGVARKRFVARARSAAYRGRTFHARAQS
jgi:hypothetical protein